MKICGGRMRKVGGCEERLIDVIATRDLKASERKK